MLRNEYIVLVLLLAVYGLLNLFRPGGLMAYLFPSICWGFLALSTLKVCGFKRIRLWFEKRVFVMAALMGIFQVTALVDAGLITGFGRSTQTFTPRGLMITSIYILSALFGIELSRSYLVRKFGRKKPVLTLGLMTILYSFIMTMSIVGFLGLLSSDPLPIADFLGLRLLPTVTLNLLASYLALIGGPTASLAYRAPLVAFEWFSPILPDLPWGFEALIGVMAPTIGFLVISQTTPQDVLRKLGITTEPKPKIFSRKAGAKKPSLWGWTIVSMLCVLLVWSSTGLLGVYGTVVISGSMRPTMDIGDVAIVVQTPINDIEPGDIIQYIQDGKMYIHRVVDIQQTEGSNLFATKGDANPEPDINPVNPSQIRGKLVFIMPKLGWITIGIRALIARIWSFFSVNITLAYMTLIATFVACIYTLHIHKRRPTKKWGRLNRKRGWLRR